MWANAAKSFVWLLSMKLKLGFQMIPRKISCKIFRSYWGSIKVVRKRVNLKLKKKRLDPDTCLPFKEGIPKRRKLTTMMKILTG